MVDILHVEYAQTGKSSSLNAYGMREMQARAFEARESQYLLLKAPPASGKSRALMFLALDKLINQGLKKVIVAVPEMSIGSSFNDTNLIKDGFFANWHVDIKNNLCIPGGESDKVNSFISFINDSKAQTLICTHATLRFAFEKINKPSDFNECLVAIDEFHHASADEDSKLGNLIDLLMKESNAHIVAMTGSYFRGDAVPILLPEDEAKFNQVTYSYYEQLNGYEYLKSLGIGYHFYQGTYADALNKVLDATKKTIIHIPHRGSSEATGDKYIEVERILSALGKVESQDPITGIITVQHKSGRKLKVADLVDDRPQRVDVQNYLRNIKSAAEMDVIIALGMAKEGFDWPYCEHVLTIGYRNSMTEIVQIIGRATRDCKGKTHAQFTNLIAQPDANDNDVKVSVNNMLKAITVSLLMEQVLAPNINFKPRSRLFDNEYIPPGTIIIEDGTAPLSPQAIQILDNLSDITAALMQKPEIAAAAVVKEAPELINQIELPKIIETLYPNLTPAEVRTIQEVYLTNVAASQGGGIYESDDLPENAEIYTPPGASVSEELSRKSLGQQFIQMSGKFINIENLNVDLIAQVNPFQGAYEILSKTFTKEMLKTIQDVVVGMRVTVTEEEAVIFWPKIEEFIETKGKEPSITSIDPLEKRYAEVIAFIRKKHQEDLTNNGN
jgi:hypothetical protein